MIESYTIALISWIIGFIFGVYLTLADYSLVNKSYLNISGLIREVIGRLITFTIAGILLLGIISFIILTCGLGSILTSFGFGGNKFETFLAMSFFGYFIGILAAIAFLIIVFFRGRRQTTKKD